MNDLISKPWTHLTCVGQGALLALMYHDILNFRKIDNEITRVRDFPWIYWIHKSRYLSTVLLSITALTVLGNLFGPY